MVGALLRGVKRSFSTCWKLQPLPAALYGHSSVPAMGAVHHQPHAPSKIAALPTAVHASNHRAIDLARTLVTAAYANVDVEMEAGQMRRVQLRFGDFGHTKIPVGGTRGEFEAELQQYHARGQEFTLAMGVPRGVGKQRRDSQCTGPSEAPRHLWLNTIFGEGQGAAKDMC